MKLLPQTERESQIITAIGVFMTFIGLAMPARDMFLIGLLVVALGIMAWVLASKRVNAERDAQR